VFQPVNVLGAETSDSNALLPRNISISTQDLVETNRRAPLLSLARRLASSVGGDAGGLDEIRFGCPPCRYSVVERAAAGT
jgi:hypothetical protein